MNENAVYIVDALRTPLGRVNGRLSATPLACLMKFVIQALAQKYSLLDKGVDEVVFGNAVSAGAGQNVVRKALIDAGLSINTPGYSVGNVCASGLQAVMNACQAIRLKEADMVIAGGAESVSQMPELIFKKNHDLKKMKNLTESLLHDGLWCSVADRWMGLLCEDLARHEKISRQEQDDYAYGSYVKAVAAQRNGYFDQEIIPVKLVADKEYVADETIRHNVSRAIFDSFESAFEYNGTITAANAAAPCDGAAGFLLASQDAIESYELKPLAQIVGYTSIAGPAEKVFGLTDEVIRACLRKTKISISQIDLFEISEAFAAQMVLFQKRLRLKPNKLNICGGDIALGHPLGAAGARALTTLVHSLQRKNKCYGLAGACLGGGGATAIIVKACI